MIQKECNKFDKDSSCYVRPSLEKQDINQMISHINAGRDVKIKPTVNIEYNEEIEKLQCEEIETDINGKPIGIGCRVQFRDNDVIKELLSRQS